MKRLAADPLCNLDTNQKRQCLPPTHYVLLRVHCGYHQYFYGRVELECSSLLNTEAQRMLTFTLQEFSVSHCVCYAVHTSDPTFVEAQLRLRLYHFVSQPDIPLFLHAIVPIPAVLKHGPPCHSHRAQHCAQLSAP